LAEIRQQAESLLQRPVRMSGSGSTLFTLYDALAAAQDVAPQIESKLPQVRALAMKLVAGFEDDWKK
jgi:4-diphosphocytidyl-2C-methyl-D-erythritol kinase